MQFSDKQDYKASVTTAKEQYNVFSDWETYFYPTVFILLWQATFWVKSKIVFNCGFPRMQ